MSEVLTGGSLVFSELNTPTRKGERINRLEEIYDIPTPFVGMSVWVTDEGCEYVVTSLRDRVVNGVVQPNAGVDTYKRKVDKTDIEEIVKLLGSFNSASEFNNRLNTLTYDPAVPGKNIGFFRTKVSHRDAEVRNILLSSGLNVIVQVVAGTFVSVNNILTLTDSGYNVFTRKHENGAWSEWLKWNGGVSDEQLEALYAAINAEAARAQAAEEELRTNIEKLMKKTFPLTLTLLVSPSTLQKYTGQAKEFSLSWGAKVADESVTPTSIVLTAGGANIPVDKTATTAKVTASNDTEIILNVEASGMTAQAKADIKYAYAAYTGVVDKNFTITADEITQLKEMSLVDGTGRSYTYDALELQKVVYAYAKVYGALTGIVDANNVNLIGNYTRSEIEINGIAYYVYITTKEFSTTGSVTYNYK